MKNRIIKIPKAVVQPTAKPTKPRSIFFRTGDTPFTGSCEATPFAIAAAEKDKPIGAALKAALDGKADVKFERYSIPTNAIAPARLHTKLRMARAVRISSLLTLMSHP